MTGKESVSLVSHCHCKLAGGDLSSFLGLSPGLLRGIWTFNTKKTKGVFNYILQSSKNMPIAGDQYCHWYNVNGWRKED